MAPLVLGQPIVELQLQTLEKEQEDDDEEMSPSVSSTLSKTVMFCVLSDGSFFVYNLSPDLCLLYKGSILPAMTHVSLGLPHEQHQQPLPPKLSKVQMTEKGHLLLLLSLQGSGRSASARAMPNDSSNRIRSLTHVEDHGAGGSIQGFVYNRALELWTWVADSRFVCSDFYKSLPSFSAKKKAMGPLSDMENSVRMGSLGSSLKPVRGRSESALIFSQAQEETMNFIPTRSHCEDRIACSLQLGSPKEVKYWLLKYAKVLILGGHESTLRIVIDMIHGSSPATTSGPLGWISSAVAILDVDRSSLIRNEILPQMGKNRSLQRLANEVQLELNRKST
jgi:protein HIRA/HIR1